MGGWKQLSTQAGCANLNVKYLKAGWGGIPRVGLIPHAKPPPFVEVGRATEAGEQCPVHPQAMCSQAHVPAHAPAHALRLQQMAEHPQPTPTWVGTQNPEPAPQFCPVIETLLLFGETLVLGGGGGGEAGQAPSAHAAATLAPGNNRWGFVGWLNRAAELESIFIQSSVRERETHATLFRCISSQASLTFLVASARDLV